MRTLQESLRHVQVIPAEALQRVHPRLEESLVGRRLRLPHPGRVLLLRRLRSVDVAASLARRPRSAGPPPCYSVHPAGRVLTDGLFSLPKCLTTQAHPVALPRHLETSKTGVAVAKRREALHSGTFRYATLGLRPS